MSVRVHEHLSVHLRGDEMDNVKCPPGSLPICIGDCSLCYLMNGQKIKIDK